MKLLSRQAAASLELDDPEQTSSYLERAAISTPKRGQISVSETYLQVQAKWQREERIKRLAELFRR